MIRAGMDALRRTQLSVLAEDMTYRRASSEKTIRAVAGRTVFCSTNDYGTWVRTETRDFIIPAGQLDAEPLRGDVIVFDGHEYEVLAPNNEAVWRWSDPHHTALRVHTKHTGGEL